MIAHKNRKQKVVMKSYIGHSSRKKYSPLPGSPKSYRDGNASPVRMMTEPASGSYSINISLLNRSRNKAIESLVGQPK